MNNTSLLIILLTGILTGNVILSRFMGICPFLGVSKKLGSAVSMSLAVIVVLVMSSAVTWPVFHYLLAPFGLEFLETVVFILIIAALVQLLEILLKRFLPPVYTALGIYLPLITTNCAVLGIAIMNIDEGYGFVASLVNAAASGLGFMVAMILFAGVRGRLDEADGIPKALQGLPITLFAAAITAISFLGFAGMI